MEKVEKYEAGFVTVPWDEINSPGTYVFKDTGDLARIPKEALMQGGSPLIEIKSRRHNVCCKLSDDPYIGISKARQLAADYDLPINF